jgi:hypothetical protein
MPKVKFPHKKHVGVAFNSTHFNFNIDLDEYYHPPSIRSSDSFAIWTFLCDLCKADSDERPEGPKDLPYFQ